MAAIAAIKRGIYLAGRIDKKYNINKIFIDKYVPPGYRKSLYKIVDIAGTLGGEYGIVRFIESLYAPDSPGNDIGIPTQRNGFKASSQSKARSRQTSRYSRWCKPRYQSRYKSGRSRFSTNR